MAGPDGKEPEPDVDPDTITRSSSEPATLTDERAAEIIGNATDPPQETLADGALTPGALTPALSATGSPLLSRNASFSDRSSFQEDWDAFPPLEKLTVFDFLDNIALPQRIEKWQQSIASQSDKVRRQREKLSRTGTQAKNRAIAEWRKRVPTSDEQVERYRQRIAKFSKRFSEATTVTLREKFSFIAGVLNVFISGYIIGACPAYFYYWYSLQLAYFFPIRFYVYHSKGYHYFLADLCYFVNFLTFLSVWVAPSSKRLLISAFCLAYGNNAVAIAMWRNSLVFHSFDKVTSLFIHIYPPVALHCLVHLTSAEYLAARFPAVYHIKFSPPTSPEHYSLWGMMVWATVPYAVWQLSYHFMITVRRREKIKAGRPTSFTWLRRSYAKTWIGRFVLSLPEYLQEPAFMMIQYLYALLTMLPCPIWFWYRWASAGFLMAVFVWSIYNGATFYIDIFSGVKFQKELENLKRDIAKMQESPNTLASAPSDTDLSGLGADHKKSKSTSDVEGVDSIPPLDGGTASVASGNDHGYVEIQQRKQSRDQVAS